MTQSFAEMFEESLVNQELRRGAVVTGTVVDIQSDSVIVNAGLKSEGVIPIEEFKNAAGDLEVQVGDEVEFTREEALGRNITDLESDPRYTGQTPLQVGTPRLLG